MVRIVLDIAVDTDEAEAVADHARDFVSHVAEHWSASVARFDVTVPPDPDRDSAAMLESYRGASG